MRPRGWCLACCVALTLGAWAPQRARALDAFEIQVYESEIAQPGQTGIEVHLNSVLLGSRQPSPDGEYPTDRVSHMTLEPHLGLLNWLEVGTYLQGAAHPGMELRPAGLKLRAKLHYPGKIFGLVGVALNGELAAVPPGYEANRLGAELRPIMDVEWAHMYFSFNPILAVDFLGADALHPHFEPAATLLFKPVDNLATGLEYYGDYGPVAQPHAPGDVVHRIFGVINVSRGPTGVHLAAGYSFNSQERVIVKAVITAELER